VNSEICHGDSVRRMRADDLARVLAWRNHPQIRRFMYTTHEISLEEHAAWFQRASADARKHLLIFEADGVPMGFANLNVATAGAIAEWGFYVAPDAPRGTGMRLGRTVLAHAFGPLGLHKVCGEALEFNERSINFHGRLGFRQEGVLRDQHFDGETYCSIVVFGLLSHEWKPL